MPITVLQEQVVATAPSSAVADYREVSRTNMEYLFEDREGAWSGPRTACTSTGLKGKGPGPCGDRYATIAGAAPSKFGWPLATLELPSAPPTGPWTFQGAVPAANGPPVDATYTCVSDAGVVTCRAALPAQPCGAQTCAPCTSLLVVQLGPDGRLTQGTLTSVFFGGAGEISYRGTTTWTWTVR